MKNKYIINPLHYCIKVIKKHNMFTMFLISSIIFSIIYYNNEYMLEKSVKCTVINKLESQGRYSSNFYLVLKEENEIIFDITVTPSNYSQLNIGDIAYFNLRKFDIKQTKIDNAIYFFGQVIPFSISICCLCVILVCFIFKIK